VIRKRDGTWVFTILLSEVASEVERLPGDNLGSIVRLLWMTKMFTYGIVEKYGRQFKQLQGVGIADDSRWSQFYSQFHDAIDAVYAEAFNMGYKRERIAEALNEDQRDAYWEQVRGWHECIKLVKDLRTTSDPEARQDICERLFEKLEKIVKNTYSIAGTRLTELTTDVSLDFEICEPVETELSNEWR
jgi:hypothetical protein